MTTDLKLIYEKWLAESESGPYKGFINQQKFSSKATSTEFYSVKNERMVYAASPLERRHFLINLEFNDRVTSYFEQYAIDPCISLDIAKKYGLRHHLNGEAIVTVDALVYYSFDQIAEFHSVKSDKDVQKFISKDLCDETMTRLEEKLLIEKISSEKYGVLWLPILDKDVPRVRFKNLEALYAGNNTTEQDRKRLCDFFLAFSKKVNALTEKTKFIEIQKELSKLLILPLDSIKKIFSLLAWNKVIEFPLDEFLEPTSMIKTDTFRVFPERLEKCIQKEAYKSMMQYRL
ncbi:hypothetical protein ACWJJH_20040 [Endozoicomonadaceae bacterium StTr2]